MLYLLFRTVPSDNLLPSEPSPWQLLKAGHVYGVLDRDLEMIAHIVSCAVGIPDADSVKDFPVSFNGGISVFSVGEGYIPVLLEGFFQLLVYTYQQ